jgi:hypothetical protein
MTMGCGLWAGQPGCGSGHSKNVFFYSVDTDYRAYLASYLMDTGRSFLGVKAASPPDWSLTYK